MQLLVQTEWWSCFATQASQEKQWFALIGFLICEKQSTVTPCVNDTVSDSVTAQCSECFTMQDVQNILGSRQPASANTSTFWQHKSKTSAQFSLKWSNGRQGYCYVFKKKKKSHHFLLLFSCPDVARVRPAGAEVVIEQSSGIQSEENLNSGAGSMWSYRSRKNSTRQHQTPEESAAEFTGSTVITEWHKHRSYNCCAAEWCFLWREDIRQEPEAPSDEHPEDWSHEGCRW